MRYPRVLVVSNNSFSKTGSNGRTLGRLFYCWPRENLAQFCISTDTPDYDVCNNYYLVTDKSALKGFVHFRKAQRCAIEHNINSKGNFTLSQKKYGKSPFRTIIRNVIWWPKRWKSKEYIQWIEDFNPEVVLLLNSDSIFMLKVAIDISKRRKIPIVIYNTEGFYFFKKPYMYCKWWEVFFFKTYQLLYRGEYSKLMKRVKQSIYANSKLQDDYYKEFHDVSNVIYTGSTLSPRQYDFSLKNPVFCYIGNLEYSRIDALIEVADVLQSINPQYVLNVYGKYSAYIEEKVKKHKGIVLKGFINYDQVIETIYSSDILFHAETQDEKWAEALRYGFSTKIADSISSGRCFVMYSSPEIAGADYIVKTGAGWFASNKEDLRKTIIKIINDADERESVLRKAKETALMYHQAQKNCEVFQHFLNEVTKQ